MTWATRESPPPDDGNPTAAAGALCASWPGAAAWGGWGAIGFTPGGGTATGPFAIGAAPAGRPDAPPPDRTGAPLTGVSSINAAICCMAVAAATRLPDRTPAKPIAKSSAIAASFGRPLDITGALA